MFDRNVVHERPQPQDRNLRQLVSYLDPQSSDQDSMCVNVGRSTHTGVNLRYILTSPRKELKPQPGIESCCGCRVMLLSCTRRHAYFSSTELPSHDRSMLERT
jgi:hypothetical protein